MDDQPHPSLPSDLIRLELGKNDGGREKHKVGLVKLLHGAWAGRRRACVIRSAAYLNCVERVACFNSISHDGRAASSSRIRQHTVNATRTPVTETAGN